MLYLFYHQHECEVVVPGINSRYIWSVQKSIRVSSSQWWLSTILNNVGNTVTYTLNTKHKIKQCRYYMYIYFNTDRAHAALDMDTPVRAYYHTQTYTNTPIPAYSHARLTTSQHPCTYTHKLAPTLKDAYTSVATTHTKHKHTTLTCALYNIYPGKRATNHSFGQLLNPTAVPSPSLTLTWSTCLTCFKYISLLLLGILQMSVCWCWWEPQTVLKPNYLEPPPAGQRVCSWRTNTSPHIYHT